MLEKFIITAGQDVDGDLRDGTRPAWEPEPTAMPYFWLAAWMRRAFSFNTDG